MYLKVKFSRSFQRYVAPGNFKRHIFNILLPGMGATLGFRLKLIVQIYDLERNEQTHAVFICL